MGELTFEALINQLKTAVYEVKFTKVNGEQRVMPCTLCAEFLPEAEATRAQTDREPNKTVIRAYAIDKQAWRSFRVENVISTSLVE